MNIIITGITGFVGSHLADYILKNHSEYTVHGIKRYRSDMGNVNHLIGNIILHDADITDASGINKLIKDIKPEKIFHLAAMSFVPSSWKNPQYTMDVNVGGTVNVLEAVKNYSPETVIQLACSSEEYGMVFIDEIPIAENNPLRPLSQYGVSKVAVDMLGYQYHKSYDLKTIRTRAFNHSGARRGKDFVISNFCKQAVEVDKGLKKQIDVGNLKAIRDFTHVKDMCRAYWTATKKCEYGDVYNISFCEGNSINEILGKILKATDLCKYNMIKFDNSKSRPSDVPILIGDSSKFRKETGWEPEYNIDDIIKDLIDYWDERI